MCTVCGCGEGEVRIEGADGKRKDAKGHQHDHAHHHHHHDHDHDHAHGHDHHHHHDHAHGEDVHHYGTGPARAHAPGMDQARMVRIEQDILGKNNAYAQANRAFFRQHGVLALNLVSSPGAGKTTLLVRTLEMLKDEFPMQVIEGDQETSNDAERIRATGVRAIQVNTGKGCHLDAHMVGHALEELKPPQGSVLFIENVGNLVCPAAFDLGEAQRVVILSVVEGEDKPLKYPDMFHSADLMLLSKVDLAPHVDFDEERCIEYARRINPDLQVLRVSARSGEGMEDWLTWIRAQRTLRLLGQQPAAAAPAAAEGEGASARDAAE